MNFKPKTQKGVSLLIVVVFVSALMLVMAGLAEVQLAFIKDIKSRRADMRLRNLAEAVSGMAQWKAGKLNSGENTGAIDAADPMMTALFEVAQDMGITNCADMDGDDLNGAQPCVSFEIEGRAQGAASTVSLNGVSYYSVPSVSVDADGEKYATGDAGIACANLTDGQIADANNACNWNKITVGQSIEIPLYWQDSQGVVTKLPAGSNFILRVRTPCENYVASHEATSDCNAEDRIELYPRVVDNKDHPEDAPFRNIYEDKVLIGWEINDSSSGKTLIPADAKQVSNYRNWPDSFNPNLNNFAGANTEISAGRINAAASFPARQSLALNNFIVLDKEYKGKDIINPGDEPIKSIKDFLGLAEVSKPILRLMFVDRPQKTPQILGTEKMTREQVRSEAYNVPYLEYQLLTASPVSDSKYTLIGFAQIEDSKMQIKKYKSMPVSAGGFVLEQF